MKKIKFCENFKLGSHCESYLKVLGHASDDIKMDSVISSKTCSKNSALAHASVADSILLGFNSHDWRDSMILEKIMDYEFWYDKMLWTNTYLCTVVKMAECRKSVHTLFI